MARLTAAARRALPDSAFADPKHRAYPMQDAGHRQAAAGLVQRFGTSKQKAQVRAKMHKGYGRGKSGGPFATK